MIRFLRKWARKLTRGEQIDSLRQQIVEMRSATKTTNAEHASRAVTVAARFETLDSQMRYCDQLMAHWEARLVPRDKQRLQSDHLLEVTRFLIHEVATQRRLLRVLSADFAADDPSVEQTAGSFDDQWGHLSEGDALLTNPEFDARVCDLVTEYTQLPAEWFAGKRVLDAGCGNGRFSVALAQLGAEVTAFDQSAHGVASVRNFSRERDLNVDVHQLNILQPLPFEPDFDLVWSYGVLHHTGDTLLAFRNVQSLVRDGGYLFLMLYGVPRWEETGDFVELNQYERLRRAIANRTLEEKIAVLEADPIVTDVHGWFDAVSPSINDIYDFEEIEGWLLQAGFANIALTAENRNHHVIAHRPPAQESSGEQTGMALNVLSMNRAA